MKPNDLKDRTKQFSLMAVKIATGLPHTMASKVLGNQLLRSGTSVGANYRAACRAKSQADFIHKIAIVIEEADETQFWIELLVESNLIERELAAPVWKEAEELVKIFTASSKTAKANKQNKIVSSS